MMKPYNQKALRELRRLDQYSFLLAKDLATNNKEKIIKDIDGIEDQLSKILEILNGA